MAIAAEVVAVEKGTQYTKKTLLLTFSGSYATGGDTLNLVTVGNAARIAGAQFHRIPLYGVITKGNPGGYKPELIKGAALTNWLIRFWSTAQTELAAAGYPAGITDNDGDFYLELYEFSA